MRDGIMDDGGGSTLEIARQIQTNLERSEKTRKKSIVRSLWLVVVSCGFFISGGCFFTNGILSVSALAMFVIGGALFVIWGIVCIVLGMGAGKDEYTRRRLGLSDTNFVQDTPRRPPDSEASLN